MRLLALDLGAAPAICVVDGTWREPVLLHSERFGRFDMIALTQRMADLMTQFGVRDVYCERTFTEVRRKKLYLANVGRKQAEQYGALVYWAHTVGAEMHQVEPVKSGEAYAAWYAFGSPPEGKCAAGEHLRDACGVALRALMQRDEKPMMARMKR